MRETENLYGFPDLFSGRFPLAVVATTKISGLLYEKGTVT
jgi:hypothetical protein